MRSIGAFLLKARQLKNVIYTLYLSGRDPRVPMYVKILLLLIIVYALSPFDVVPDFLPLFGYMDDLIVLPLGIYLVLKLIPEEVKAEYHAKARMKLPGSNLKWLVLAVTIFIWLLIAFWIIAVFWL